MSLNLNTTDTFDNYTHVFNIKFPHILNKYFTDIDAQLTLNRLNEGNSSQNYSCQNITSLGCLIFYGTKNNLALRRFLHKS